MEKSLCIFSSQSQYSCKSNSLITRVRDRNNLFMPKLLVQESGVLVGCDAVVCSFFATDLWLVGWLTFPVRVLQGVI